MTSSILVRVLDFTDNQKLSSLVDSKGVKKWLSPEEQLAVKRTLWQTLNNVVNNSDRLRWNIIIQVDNILKWQKLPDIDSKSEALIVWWFPGVSNEWNEQLTDYAENVIRRAVDGYQSYLWFCYWHQGLAKAYWWELLIMWKEAIWPRYYSLNDIWLEDGLFSKLWDKHIWTIAWHRRRVESLGTENEITTLWKGWDWEYQIIKVGDRARGFQWHPDYDKDWMIWRLRLWRRVIFQEWNIPDDIITQIQNPLFTNESSKTIEYFLEWLLKR